MSIGETLQRDVDAAKALFHNVEHNLVLDAREAFHEAHVLADSLAAKIVELGKATGVTPHIEAAVNAIKPVLDSVAAHVVAVAEPVVEKVTAAVDAAAQAVMAEPAAPTGAAEPASPPAPAVAVDPEPEADAPIVVPIAAGHADVTA